MTKKKTAELAVLIPAYNCAHSIAELIKDIQKRNIVDLIIVVDDCSSDQTSAKAKRFDNVLVYRNKVNKGYGGTSNLLYELALKHKVKFAINIHGDGGHKIDDLWPLVSEIKKNKHDFVIASRLKYIKNQFHKHGFNTITNKTLRGGMPLIRLVGHLILTELQNRVLNIKIDSYHEGMRAVSAQGIRWILSQNLPAWYQYDNQLISYAAIEGHKISEIECKPNYSAQAQSSAPPVKYGLAVIKLMFKIRKDLKK